MGGPRGWRLHLAVREFRKDEAGTGSALRRPESTRQLLRVPVHPTPQDVPEQRSMEYPKLYEPGQLNLLFNKREFFICIAQGIYTSVLMFFIPYGVFAEATRDDGTQLADYQSFAVTVATSLVIVVSVQVGSRQGGCPGPRRSVSGGFLPVTAAALRRSGWTPATGRPSTTSSSGAAWPCTSPSSSPCTATGSSACSPTSSALWVSPRGFRLSD